MFGFLGGIGVIEIRHPGNHENLKSWRLWRNSRGICSKTDFQLGVYEKPRGFLQTMSTGARFFQGWGAQRGLRSEPRD